MGTSKAYDGSGGQWRKVRREAQKLAEADTDGLDTIGIDALVAQLVGTSIDTLGWHGPALRQSGGGGTDGPAAGGAAARSTRGESAGRRAGGTNLHTHLGRAAAARSATTALRAAYRVAGGGGGGASGGLPELGISHAQLAAANPFEQCAAIVDAVRDGNSLADDAIAAANREAVLAILTAESPPPPEVAVRIFVTELLSHIIITEIGQTLRQHTDAAASVRQERRIRDCVEAVVDQLPLLALDHGGRITATELSQTIESGLSRLYDIHIPGHAS
ncbi:hypothetical protein AB0K21_40310 [Streptosporangium sp. NPDC049248]|uniref:hypothetical protein n=1 Tax=Streptosporangium sp. NPDC049248 TaxID=3155651 RepID=UPI0034155F8B